MSEQATTDQPSDYVAVDVKFDDLPLSEEVRRAIRDRGYVSPTPVPVFERTIRSRPESTAG